MKMAFKPCGVVVAKSPLTGKIYRFDSTTYDHMGGEGYIYIRGDLVYKMYRDTKQKELPTLERKITHMVKHPPAANVLQYMTWPLDVLYINGSFMGFVMNKLASTTELKALYVFSGDELIKDVPLRLLVAMNLCRLLNEIHKVGYIIGDFNDNNVCFVSDKSSKYYGQVFMYDCDSMEFKDDYGREFLCTVAKQQYLAPEIYAEYDDTKRRWNAMGKKGSPSYYDLKLGFTQETDLFALGIHIFRLLNYGAKPFDSVKEGFRDSINNMSYDDDEDDYEVWDEKYSVTHFKFCWNPGVEPYAIYCPSSKEYPSELVDLFYKTFNTEGLKGRPKPLEWSRILMRYYSKQCKKCTLDREHIFWISIQKCPYCEGVRRSKEAIASVNKQSAVRQNELSRRYNASPTVHHTTYNPQPTTGGRGYNRIRRRPLFNLPNLRLPRISLPKMKFPFTKGSNRIRLGSIFRYVNDNYTALYFAALIIICVIFTIAAAWNGTFDAGSVIGLWLMILVPPGAAILISNYAFNSFWGIGICLIGAALFFISNGGITGMMAALMPILCIPAVLKNS